MAEMHNNLHARLNWVITQFNVILQHFIKTLFTVNKSATSEITKYSPQTFSINAVANSWKIKARLVYIETDSFKWQSRRKNKQQYCVL